MPDSPTFSIVLCTRNRAELLSEALNSVLAVDYPPDDFELVLVDNASSDETRTVAERFRAKAPFAVRVVREDEIGLSAARNRGIREARGRYLFFTDDDQTLDPAVLKEHRRVALERNARVVQGGIALAFSVRRPEWLRGTLAALLGETPDLPEGSTTLPLFGGNMLIRRDVFDSVEPFRHDLGKGRAGYSEDSELTERLRAQGEVVVYAPSAKVFHVIAGDRATPGFFRRIAFDKGRSHGALDAGASDVKKRARDTARDARLAGSDAFASMLKRDRHGAIEAQARALFSLGRLWTQTRLLLRRNPR